MTSKVSQFPTTVATIGVPSDKGQKTDTNAIALPTSTASPSRDAPSSAPVSANVANAPLTSSALEIRPNTERLLCFKHALAHHPALDKWIRIDSSQACGLLEQGRFESRFAPLARFSVSPDESPMRNLATNSSTDTNHPTAVSDDAVEARKWRNGAVTQTPIGWRATLLAYDQTAILASSAAMFASIRQPALLISLDRMTRTMHSMNFFASPASGLLFLPVHEGLLLNVRHDHGQYFAALLLSLRINPAKIVIEIPALFATKTTLLAQLIASYHKYGFKVALSLPEGFGFGTLPITSKPDFLLADLDPDRNAMRDDTHRTAHPQTLSPEESALLSLANFAFRYGATLVAGPRTNRSAFIE